MPNSLEEQLRHIQHYRNIAQKKLDKEPNADARVALVKRIMKYDRREKEVLDQLNLRLKDIELTEKKKE